MFQMRKSKPAKGNKFYTRVPKGGYNTCVQGRPTDACDALSNCVGYAEGRFNEIISEIQGKDVFPYNTLYCNAENFIERAKSVGLEVSQVPVKGGIMVWQKGESLKGADGAGHVEIVEDVLEVDTNGNPVKIYTSGSNYGAEAFFNVTRTNNNGRWGLGSSYKFRGCIVNPYVKEEPKPEPVKPEPTPTPVKVEIKEGDTVIVNGYGTASSDGTGARTRDFKDTKMKVIGISSKTSRPNRYALNQYNRGEVKNWSHVTAWFREEDITKEV